MEEIGSDSQGAPVPPTTLSLGPALFGRSPRVRPVDPPGSSRGVLVSPQGRSAGERRGLECTGSKSPSGMISLSES